MRASTGVRPDRVVEGVIKANAWAVPSNQTWRVGAKGVIVYANRITIDGVLEVGSGARFALLAPYVRINGGGIKPLPPSPVRTETQEADDVISTCDFRAGNVQAVYSTAIALPPGDSLFVSASDRNCDFKIFGIVTTGPGRAGDPTSLTVRAGEPGGVIEFGTLDANGLAVAVAKEIGETIQTHQPNSLAVYGTISAGWGGNGASDVDGTFDRASDTWSFKPAAGGAGGSITFDIFTFTVLPYGSFFSSAGRGGNGGGVGTVSLDGIPTAPNAGSLEITQSSGGAGGSVDALPRVKGQRPISAGGNGGDSGVISAATGAGWDGLAGLGGDMHVVWRRPAKAARATPAFRRRMASIHR